jgi:hypothetical protein
MVLKHGEQDKPKSYVQHCMLYLLLKMSDTFYTKSDGYVTFDLFGKINSSLLPITEHKIVSSFNIVKLSCDNRF